MSAHELRLGLVGCGYWGSKHARVLSTLVGPDALTLVDPDERKLLAVARGLPGARTSHSMDAALEDVDALVIATPPTTHVPLALQAIRAGRHVLVEKPVALDTRGMRALMRAAGEQGVVLMAGHTFEYNAAVWELRRLVDDGTLGELFYIDTARLNLGLYQNDVNVIYDLAPHDISVVNFLLRRPPVAVEAWAARHAHHRFEDVAYLRLFYEGTDLSANIHVSWLDPCKVRRVTVVGANRMVVYNDLAAEERIRIYDKGVELPRDLDASAAPPMSYRYGDIVSPYFTFDEPLTVEDRHFADCILNGTTPRTDGADALAVVQTLECAQLSIARHRPVTLQQLDDLATSPDGAVPVARAS